MARNPFECPRLHGRSSEKSSDRTQERLCTKSHSDRFTKLLFFRILKHLLMFDVYVEWKLETICIAKSDRGITQCVYWCLQVFDPHGLIDGRGAKFPEFALLTTHQFDIYFSNNDQTMQIYDKSPIHFPILPILWYSFKSLHPWSTNSGLWRRVSLLVCFWFGFACVRTFLHNVDELCINMHGVQASNSILCLSVSLTFQCVDLAQITRLRSVLQAKHIEDGRQHEVPQTTGSVFEVEK